MTHEEIYAMEIEGYQRDLARLSVFIRRSERRLDELRAEMSAAEEMGDDELHDMYEETREQVMQGYEQEIAYETKFLEDSCDEKFRCEACMGVLEDSERYRNMENPPCYAAG